MDVFDSLSVSKRCTSPCLSGHKMKNHQIWVSKGTCNKSALVVHVGKRKCQSFDNF